MSRAKKIVLISVIVFVVIQFIQPVHNESKQISPADFVTVCAAPERVQSVLQNACSDCHSNNTFYPWYSGIQPFAWIMASHIKNGKDKLNLSEFGNYTTRRQVSKLKGIVSQIKDDEMPLYAYRMMHRNARISGAEKKFIIEWMEKKADSLSTPN